MAPHVWLGLPAAALIAVGVGLAVLSALEARASEARRAGVQVAAIVLSATAAAAATGPQPLLPAVLYLLAARLAQRPIAGAILLFASACVLCGAVRWSVHGAPIAVATAHAVFPVVLVGLFGAQTVRRARWQERRLGSELRVEVARERAARLRLARDVHDGIGSRISAATLQVGVAARALGQRPEVAARALETVERLLREATAGVHELGPVVDADAAELVRVVDGIARDLVDGSELVLDASLIVEGEQVTVPGQVAWAVEQIVREALTNVVRHACATRVSLRLELSNRAARVVVRDDGRGLGGSTAGRGRNGMLARLAGLDGTFVLDSTHRGTSLVVTMPYAVARSGVADRPRAVPAWYASVVVGAGLVFLPELPVFSESTHLGLWTRLALVAPWPALALASWRLARPGPLVAPLVGMVGSALLVLGSGKPDSLFWAGFLTQLWTAAELAPLASAGARRLAAAAVISVPVAVAFGYGATAGLAAAGAPLVLGGLFGWLYAMLARTAARIHADRTRAVALAVERTRRELADHRAALVTRAREDLDLSLASARELLREARSLGPDAGTRVARLERRIREALVALRAMLDLIDDGPSSAAAK